MPVAPAAPQHTTRYDDDRPAAAPQAADSQPPLPPPVLAAPLPGPLSLYAAPPPLPVEQPVEQQSRFDPESGVLEPVPDCYSLSGALKHSPSPTCLISLYDPDGCVNSISRQTCRCHTAMRVMQLAMLAQATAGST